MPKHGSGGQRDRATSTNTRNVDDGARTFWRAAVGPVKRPLHCGQPMVQIVYGFPSDELFDASDRGEVVLGGCVISGDSPTFVCSVCDATASREADIGEPVEEEPWE